MSVAVFLIVIFTATAFKLVDCSPIIDPQRLEDALRNMANEGLGVSDMQNYVDRRIAYRIKVPDGKLLLNQLSAKLEYQFSTRMEALLNNKKKIEEAYQTFTVWTAYGQCCNLDGLTYDLRFKQKVKLNSMCYRQSAVAASALPKQLSKDILDTMKNNLAADSTLKWQYFGSEEGVMTMFPAASVPSCTSYDPRFRPWYVEAATAQPREIVLAIDMSISMEAKYNEQTLISIAKSAAVTVLDTLTPDDMVTVVSFSSYGHVPPGSSELSSCFSKEMAAATPQNIEYLKSYIRSLHTLQGGTSYVAALSKAFYMLSKSNGKALSNNRTRDKVILFLTDGEPFEQKQDIETRLRIENSRFSNKVVLLTYGIGEFLSANAQTILDVMAQQPFADISYGPAKAGVFRHILSPDQLRTEMGSYYDFFSKPSTLNTPPVLTVPYYDALGLGLIMTAATPVYHAGTLVGVAGIDIQMSDLMQSVSYNRHYSFVIDSSARTLFHPLLPQPTDYSSMPIIVDIRMLEPTAQAEGVISDMLSGHSGQKSFLTQPVDVFKLGTSSIPVLSHYYWKTVNGTDFRLCVVVFDGQVEPLLQSLQPQSSAFIYHRIDIKPPPHKCSHFDHVSTKAMSVIKFAPECFEQPYEYMNMLETPSSVDRIEQYITGKTDAYDLNFKHGIQNTVTMTSYLNEVWLIGHTGLIQNTVWRYYGSSDGVFRIIPGVVLPKIYDPTQQKWYRNARANPGKNTLTGPRLDPFGAGFVITLSHTIFMANQTRDHQSADPVIGVLGADFTLPYFYNLLSKQYPVCSESNKFCFVIDDSGFIVIHPDYIEARTTNLPIVEDVHITSKEPSIATTLILAGIMTRSSCLNISDVAVKHSWKVSITKEEYYISTGVPLFQIHTVPTSNVFIVVANVSPQYHSCECAPKLKEYKCLQPKRLSYCECPCYSAAMYQYCQDHYIPGENPYPPCIPAAPKINPTTAVQSEVAAAKLLLKCFQGLVLTRLAAVGVNAIRTHFVCRNHIVRVRMNVHLGFRLHQTPMVTLLQQHPFHQV
ncbi:VWFA and cache domain-containing protein 1-like isoform X2 [Tubulanus polymorphus]|uniref:VWFA and cache domain-containing protein 1-like isoform X2 n=1 Tax=Tubulanus polymorphus TaxID=672921 RepID=UPI003DA32CBD